MNSFQKEDGVVEKIESLSFLHNIRITLDQLIETKIFFSCLKGYSLSYRLYQDPSIRKSKDLDIFIPDRDDVLKLSQILISKGWVSQGEWVNDVPRRNWFMDLKHELSLFNPETGIWLEIHWELDAHFLKFSQAERIRFGSKYVEKMEVMGRVINVLRPDFELIYLLVHGAKHGWFRLKWLLDIHHYPFHLVDEGQFELLVKKFQAEILVAQANELLTRYFGKGFPITMKVKAPDYVIKYAGMRIEGKIWDSRPSLKQFFQTLRYDFLLQKEPWKAFKRVFLRLGIRPQDITEIKLNAFWKYYFYRYYSLLKRKVF